MVGCYTNTCARSGTAVRSVTPITLRPTFAGEMPASPSTQGTSSSTRAATCQSPLYDPGCAAARVRCEGKFLRGSARTTSRWPTHAVRIDKQDIWIVDRARTRQEMIPRARPVVFERRGGRLTSTLPPSYPSQLSGIWSAPASRKCRTTTRAAPPRASRQRLQPADHVQRGTRRAIRRLHGRLRQLAGRKVNAKGEWMPAEARSATAGAVRHAAGCRGPEGRNLRRRSLAAHQVLIPGRFCVSSHRLKVTPKRIIFV